MVDFLSKHKLLIHSQNGFLKLRQETKGRSGRSSFKLEINLKFAVDTKLLDQLREG